MPGLEPRTSAMSVQCSANLGAGQFVELICFDLEMSCFNPLAGILPKPAEETQIIRRKRVSISVKYSSPQL